MKISPKAYCYCAQRDTIYSVFPFADLGLLLDEPCTN